MASSNKNGCSTAVVRITSTAASLPPVAYVALTGHAPQWVRIWFIAWLAPWLVVTIATAALVGITST